MNQEPAIRHPVASRLLSVARNAAVVLLRTFVRRGVNVAFGIPGGSVSPIFDALADVPQITYVATRHETIAAFAAMGYARATGRPALVLTTSGPGITNAMTGIAAAEIEELPIILLSGEVATRAVGRAALQDGTTSGLDTVALLRTLTRWSSTLSSAAAAQGVAERACDAALGSRRGPVFVSVPLDVGAAESHELRIACGVVPITAPDPDACRLAAKRLAAAQRPLLVLGNGARSASAHAIALAERLALPVVVTPHAKGVFPEYHPLYLGLVGVGQHPSATAYIEERPDVTCIVGSRLGDIATNGWTLDLSGASATIQIDRDPWLVGRNVRATLGIVGDASLTLRQIMTDLPHDVARPARTLGCRTLRAETSHSDAVPLKPQRVLAALSEAFPDAIWCSDIGEHLSMALHYLRVTGTDRFHAMVGLGSMGSGIGTAIGIKRARPDATVIALCGDGGFAMHAGEILTCSESGTSVIFAVFNDGLWNMVEHGFRAVYGRTPAGLPIQIADLGLVARGFGAFGVTISEIAELDPSTLRSHCGTGRPVVLDLRIDPSESLSKGTRSAALRHFAHGQNR